MGHDETTGRPGGDTESGPGTGDSTPRGLVYAEFAVWVVALTAVLGLVSTVVGVAAGGLGVAKTVLFVLGFLLFGLGAVELRPSNPYIEDEDDDAAPTPAPDPADDYGPFDRLLRRVMPLDGLNLPPDRRIGRGPRWLVAAVLVLALSYLMERVLGAGVGT